MIPLALALALQLAAPDEELGALVGCQFAVSREESARRSSVEAFGQAVERACASEKAIFSRRALAFLVARGRPEAEARAELDRLLDEQRATLLQSYARILELSR